MKFLTKEEVADLLRVSVRTITEYRAKGLLPPPRKLGRRLLWDEGELSQTLSLPSTPVHMKAAPAISPAPRGRPRKVTFM